MSEIVAREILDDIHASNLVPGDRLPAESIMLRQYNIGRSTLREALRLLEVYGVLTIRSGPGGGPVLVEIRPRDIAQVMQLFLSVSGFTLGDVTDSLYFLQEMLARQAAAERDPTQLAALRKVVEAEPTDDRREFHRTISGFHHVMAELPRGRMLRVIVQAMEEMMTLQIGKQVDIHDAKENLRDHVDITDAIEAGDSDRAAELMAEHTTRVVRLLRKSAPGALDRRVEWT